MGKQCNLSTGKLPLGSLHRNSVVRMIDCPDMTSAVYLGRKATNQTKSIVTLALAPDQYHRGCSAGKEKRQW